VSITRGMTDGGTSAALVARASSSTIASLFAARARIHPSRTAIEDAARVLSYREVAERTRRLAGALAASGVTRGTPIAILSENRAEYLEVILAAARLGAVVACQSWRLAAPELARCLDLVSPAYTFVSPRHSGRLSASRAPAVVFGPEYERLATVTEPIPFDVSAEVETEDAILILYTSGTTGSPKGAVLGHRAEVVRNLVTRAEFGIAVDDTFAAWSPLYHMGGVENSLGALMSGGSVIVVDGFDAPRLAEIVATRELGWLLLMPGMVGALAAELRARCVRPRGVKVCGVMADLVPRAEIAEITTLLGAPYANTFGATETGCPPCSSSLIPIGVVPSRLSKQVSPFCEVRLVDAQDRDVPDGVAGELAMRGPTLFSGYWRAEEANAHDFRGGWFHMGDVFVRNPDGTLDFVDRVKYLIKTGGENVYPAEIERVLLQDPRVADAAVVRRPDPRWGEVPIAFVARREGPEGRALGSRDLFVRCRAELAGFKQPKGIVFLALDAFPRSASGKVQRHELERRLEDHDVEGPPT
jgi:acyl-CoA synthetase (AMP-forming)/AMP-acid ligase II